jgi:tRNA modification GTPase
MIGRDTIAAIATPPGVGGIGLIRVSGGAAALIARRLFRPARPLDEFQSHRLYHGEIIVPETGRVLDDVLVSFLKGPHTYTGEDTLEISCHGGPLILRAVLGEVLRAGARPAERGEFTLRAFLNGRIDLAQAEAVLDMITARTDEGLNAALQRLKGRLTERIEAIRGVIVDLLAGIEAVIDFSQEDGLPSQSVPRESEFQVIIDELLSLAATCRQGKILREGFGMVIAGRPNVGKSSLLNRLLGQKRAIVTPIPGTTRDFIEETADIGGIPLRLTDTAGIRAPENVIEKEGIDLVWERLADADALLVLLDGSMALMPEDRQLLARLPDKPVLLAINKTDLPQLLDEAELRGLLPSVSIPPVRISAKYGQGIDGLTEAIRGLVLAMPGQEMPEVMIADLRQKAALDRTVECLGRARDGLREGLPCELVALDVRESLDALGEITGRTVSEEVLHRIFERFCIGK